MRGKHPRFGPDSTQANPDRRLPLWRARYIGRVALYLLCFTLLATWTRPTRAATETPEESPELGFGLTVGIADADRTALLLGVDAWYRWSRHFAAGFEEQLLYIGLGADPQYCHGCLESAQLLMGFVEARAGAGKIWSFFARVGVGPAFLEKVPEEGGFDRDTILRPALQAAIGPQLTLWHVFLRPRGTLTTLTETTFLGLSLELGAAL